MDLNYPIIFNNKNLRDGNIYTNQHFDEAEKEMAKFPKVDGVIKDSNLVDFIMCPVCNSNNKKQILVKWGGRYDSCNDCSHVYLSNPFKQEILSQLYNDSVVDDLSRKIANHSFNNKYWLAVYEKYMDYLANRSGKRGKLLDVGCGTGRFLRFCKEKYEFDLYAMDVYKELINSVGTIIDKDNIYLCHNFVDCKISQKFKIITLWGVLEHCKEPNGILSKCLHHLEDDGYLFILVPNFYSRARQILGIYTPTLNPREHINFFTYESMMKLAFSNNFKIDGFYQELPVIDLMWSYVDDDKSLINDIVKFKECYYHVYILKKNR